MAKDTQTIQVTVPHLAGSKTHKRYRRARCEFGGVGPHVIDVTDDQLEALVADKRLVVTEPAPPPKPIKAKSSGKSNGGGKDKSKS